MYIVKVITDKENFYYAKDDDKGIPNLTRDINKSMTYKTRREANNKSSVLKNNICGLVNWIKSNQRFDRYNYPEEIMKKSFTVEVKEANICEV